MSTVVTQQNISNKTRQKENGGFLFGVFVAVTCILFSFVFSSQALAAEVAVDTTVFTTNGQGNNSSPHAVWISDQVGYVFYLGVEGDLEMASTTNGGATWQVRNAIDSVNTTDVVSYAIWWDGWTAPGTTTQYIHIATTDTSVDDIYYTRLDINTQATSTTVVTTTQTAVCVRGSNCQVSITKASNNVLYVSTSDARDAWVDSCTTTCTSTANWSERTNAYYQGLTTRGYPILMPVGGNNNIMLTYWATSTGAVYYNIYSATSSSWLYATTSTTTLASAKDTNATFDGMLFGMAHATATGVMALALVDDANDYTTQDHDINFYTYSSTTGWVAKTDVVTTASGGLIGAKVSYDSFTGTWYVIYGRRTTIGTATTANIYYKTSTDGGTSWSSESPAVNDNVDAINGLTTSITSYERIGAWWDYTTAPRADQEFYDVVADLNAPATAGFTLSGMLFSDEGVTAITSGKTIAVAVGTSTVSLHATTSQASGAWSFAIPSGQTVASSTPILMFVDGDTSTRAALFTKASSSVNNISGLNLYQNRVIISHEGTVNGTSTTLTDLSFYDNDDDADIQYNASSTANTFVVQAGNELHILSNKTFNATGTVTVRGNASSTSLVDGTLHLATSSVYKSVGTTTLAGSFIASTSATYTHATGTLVFNATTTGKYINAQIATLGSTTFNGVGGGWTFSTTSTTSNLTIATGTVTAPPNLTITGNYSNTGKFNGTTEWTARPASEANQWRSVTYGNGIFVAVSFDGTNRVMRSADGITWTPHSAATANAWTDVVYGNGTFVAVAFDGAVMRSADGITWTSQTASEANEWYALTYGNGLFVAVAESGTNRVMTSPDGITWTARSAAEANEWTDVVYGNGLFVAVAYAGGTRLMTSPDGITWTARTPSDLAVWRSVTYGNGLFVAVAEAIPNQIMTSPDGITWTGRPAPNPTNDLQSITYGNGLFVAVGYSGTDNIITSPDGINWTARTPSEVSDWYSVTYGNGLFVAVSDEGTNRVMTSYDSTTTFNSASAQTATGTMTEASQFRNVSFSGAGTKTFSAKASTTNFTVNSGATVVAPSHLSIGGDYANYGTATFSTGTTTFYGESTETATGTMTGTSAFQTLAFTGTGMRIFATNASSTNFVIGSSSRVTAPQNLSISGNYSNAGQFIGTTNWTTRSAIASNAWQSVTYGNGLFVAVSNDGTNRVMRSTDGITWATSSPAAANVWSAVTYGNGVFVAVSATTSTSTGVMTSSDGITWTSRASALPQDWSAVTYGNGLFVAVATNNVTYGAMTSPDGITWTRQNTSDGWFRSIAYGNGTFVGMRDYAVLTSPDGVVWTDQTEPLDANLQSVTFGNGMFVVVSSITSTSSNIMTSPDGITWTLRSASEANSWRSVTYGNGLFVAVADDATKNIVMTSPNGITWTSRPMSSSGNDWTSVTYGNGLFVAVAGSGNDRVMTSFDSTTTFSGASAQNATGTMTGASQFRNVSFSGVGVKTFGTNASTTKFTVGSNASVTLPFHISIAGDYTNNGKVTTQTDWTARTPSDVGTWYSVVYGNGTWVALSVNASNRVMTSPDGITWTGRTAAQANSWKDVTYGAGLFVAVSDDGTNRVMTSPDGITWSPQNAAAAQQWWTVTYGNGVFVAIANTGQVMSSPDGVNWTSQTTAELTFWYEVTYGNGLFVAVANAGTNRVMTSPDGITWTGRTAAEANEWQGVAYGNGIYVAIAQSGTNRVMTSPDGITWSPVASPSSGWQSVTYGNGLFVAVAWNGTGNQVMTSPDGINWTQGTNPGSSGWNGVAYGGGAFVAVSFSGGSHYIMTSHDSTTTFNGSIAQSLSGNMTGTSQLRGTSLMGVGTKTFLSNASTTNFTNTTSATVTAPTLLSVSGNYTNTGATTTFTGSTVIFDGVQQQRATGTLTASNAFNNLTIRNYSGTGSTTATTTQAIVFGSSFKTLGTFTMSGASSARFLANATATLQNISLFGSSTLPVYLRSSASGTPWYLSVPGTQELVSYVNVKDSNACASGSIDASNGTNADLGGNTCWAFTASSPILSSANDQVFSYGNSATAIETITITDASTPGITSANDIRIKIATSTVRMLWDTTDTTATIGGNASGKVSGTVSYDGGGSVLVLDVTSNFSASDSITISDLSFTSFTATNTALTALNVYTGGASDIVSDDADNRTVGISGSLVLANHASDQVSDSFSATSDTDVELFVFNLTPAGEDAEIDSLAVSALGIQGIVSGDITNALLYRDTNANQVHDGADIAVGGSGAVSFLGQSGTITFATNFTATTSQNYILVADIADISSGDYMTLGLYGAGLVANGSLTTVLITERGSVSTVQHMKGSFGGGGSSGAVGGDAPAGDGVRGGGGQGGGGGVDPDSGDTIGSEFGFFPPASNGTPQSSWTGGASAYSSDGAYTTTASNGARHTFGTFGFNVPSNNTITGIGVKLEASGSTAAGTISVRLSWDGGSSLTTLQTTGTLGLTDAVYELGGASDTWGRSWTPAEIDNGNFTIEIIGNTSANTINVDAIQVRVYHQSSGGGGGGGGAVFKQPNQYFANVYTAVGDVWIGWARFLLPFLFD